MNQITVIGDIHGRDIWKQICEIEKSKTGHIVFIGDYFDSFDIGLEQQLNNFRDIVALKAANPNFITLLFGNHDYHYSGISSMKYSGFQQKGYWNINKELEKAFQNKFISMAYQHGNVLCTHAGVTKTWLNDSYNGHVPKDVSIADAVNDIFKYRPKLFEFTAGDKVDLYGDELCQTPIWVRPNSLEEDQVDIIQAVGHTQYVQPFMHGSPGIIQCDSLQYNNYVNIHFKDNLFTNFTHQKLN